MDRTLRGRAKTLYQFVCFCYIFCLTGVMGQCSEVQSVEEPSLKICASLHLYKDESYSERLLSPKISKSGWIFGAVVSRVDVEFLDCWVTAQETGKNYFVLENGCLSERTYGVNRGIDRFHKIFGKFLQFSTAVETTFKLTCNVSMDCPVVSGCLRLCNRQPPRMFQLDSEIITSTDAATENGSSESGGLSRDHLMILLITLAAAFFLIFLILLIVLICMNKRKKKRRREVQNSPPQPVSSTNHSMEQF